MSTLWLLLNVIIFEVRETYVKHSTFVSDLFSCLCSLHVEQGWTRGKLQQFNNRWCRTPAPLNPLICSLRWTTYPVQPHIKKGSKTAPIHLSVYEIQWSGDMFVSQQFKVSVKQIFALISGKTDGGCETTKGKWRIVQLSGFISVWRCLQGPFLLHVGAYYPIGIFWVALFSL